MDVVQQLFQSGCTAHHRRLLTSQLFNLSAHLVNLMKSSRLSIFWKLLICSHASDHDAHWHAIKINFKLLNSVAETYGRLGEFESETAFHSKVLAMECKVKFNSMLSSGSDQVFESRQSFISRQQRFGFPTYSGVCIPGQYHLPATAPAVASISTSALQAEAPASAQPIVILSKSCSQQPLALSNSFSTNH